MKIKLLALSLMPLFLMSCTEAIKTGEPIPGIDVVENKIALSVETTSRANAAIAEVEVATANPVRPPPRPPEYVAPPPELLQLIAVQHNGTPEELLEDMANRAGYKFVISGRVPTNNIIINFNSRSDKIGGEEPIYAIVQRVGNQIHGYGDVKTYTDLRMIELDYGG